MQLEKAIKERHSVRKFSTKKVNWRKVVKAIDLARLAPLAGNIPSLKFMVIFDEEKIHKIMDACQQSLFQNASFIVVVCSKKDQCVRSYGTRGEKYCKQQAGAAIQNFLLGITDLGLATCWVGAFADKNIKQILTIPEEIDVEAIFPIGYEMGKSRQKPKPDLETCMYFNKWKQKKMYKNKMPEA